MINKLENIKYWVLLISLLGTFILTPFLVNHDSLRYIAGTIFQITLAFSVAIITHNRKTLLIALILVLPLIIHNLDTLGIINTGITLYFSYLSGIVFFAYMIILIGREVFLSRHVSLNTISGAVSIYMLLGLMWAYIYGLIVVVDPNAFSVPINPLAIENDLVYFSMITITTLGYGDIAPVSAAAKSFAAMESMIGQIYMTVLVARLVGLHLSQNSR